MPEVPRPRKPRTTAKTGTTETTDSTKTAKETPPPPLSSSPTVKRTPADQKLTDAVAAMYSGVGMLVMGIGIPRAQASGDGRIAQTGLDIQNNAEKFAEAWMTCADRNPKVKATLKKVTEGGAFAEVVALHLSLLLPYLPGIPGLAGMAVPDESPNGVHTPNL